MHLFIYKYIIVIFGIRLIYISLVLYILLLFIILNTCESPVYFAKWTAAEFFIEFNRLQNWCSRVKYFESLLNWFLVTFLNHQTGPIKPLLHPSIFSPLHQQQQTFSINQINCVSLFRTAFNNWLRTGNNYIRLRP